VIFFLQFSDTVGWATGRASGLYKNFGCWFVDGDDLTGALHILYLQMSPPLPSSLASIKPPYPGSPGRMAIKTERERMYCYCMMVFVKLLYDSTWSFVY